MSILGFILLATIILTAVISAPLALMILVTNKDPASMYIGTLLLVYPTLVYFKVISMSTASSRNTLTETIAQQLLNIYKTSNNETSE